MVMFSLIVWVLGIEILNQQETLNAFTFVFQLSPPVESLIVTRAPPGKVPATAARARRQSANAITKLTQPL